MEVQKVQIDYWTHQIKWWLITHRYWGPKRFEEVHQRGSRGSTRTGRQNSRKCFQKKIPRRFGGSAWLTILWEATPRATKFGAVLALTGRSKPAPGSMRFDLHFENGGSSGSLAGWLDEAGWPWPSMAGHGRPWPALASHVGPWLAMAGHGRTSRPPRPAMFSHGGIKLGNRLGQVAIADLSLTLSRI